MVLKFQSKSRWPFTLPDMALYLKFANDSTKRPKYNGRYFIDHIFNFLAHLMMTSSNGNISALLALCAGNSPVTGEFPPQRPVKRSFDVSLSAPSIKGWVNNREAGDLRRHRARYDVSVMWRYQAINRRSGDSTSCMFTSNILWQSIASNKTFCQCYSRLTARSWVFSAFQITKWL